VSDMQRMARAQFLQGFLGKGLNDQNILRRIFAAAAIENIDELFPEAPKGPPPEVLAKFAELSAKIDTMHADAENKRANAMKALADAEAAGGAIDLGHLRLILDTLTAHAGAQQQAQQAAAAPAPDAPVAA